MKIKLLILILLLPVLVLAQDPEYSQFYANPMHLNPAFAGTTELPRAVISYRNQWPAKGNSFTTYSLSYDFLLKKKNAGIGIQLYHDREPNNIISTNSAMLAYSYHLQLGFESFMTFGLNAGMVLKQFDGNSLIFPSNIDQLSGEITGSNPLFDGTINKNYPDFGVGAVGQHRDLFWGISAQHLTQPDESITDGDNKGKLDVKYTVHAGMRTRKLHHGLLSREFTLSPNILYQQQGSFKQINLGVYMIERSIQFGLWFRNNIDVRPDAIIALVGIAKNKFQFGYSFDYTLSKLSNYSYGSHELSLTFFIGRIGESRIRNKLLIPMI